MKAPLSSSTAFRALTQQQCKSLLKNQRVGRVAAGLEGWPAILPVNYVFDGTNIAIRTGFGAKLEELPMSAVAFEIDDWDPDGEWGWSVLVQGPAFDITDSVDTASAALRAMTIETFAPGRKDHWLRITGVRISGRAFGAGDYPEDDN